MSARPLEGETVAARADPRIDDPPGIGVVDRQEGPDPPGISTLGEQVAHSAQIARAFLAHRADEQQGLTGGDRIGLQQPCPDQQRGKPETVIADTRRHQPLALARHLDRRAFGKDGVEMGRDDEHRPLLAPGSQAEDIALGIDGHIGDPRIAQHLREQRGARGLLERRRGGFGDADEIGDHLIILRIKLCVERGSERAGGAGPGLRLNEWQACRQRQRQRRRHSHQPPCRHRAAPCVTVRQQSQPARVAARGRA